DYGGNISLIYNIPKSENDFIESGWLPSCAEKGSLQADISAPAGYSSLIIPFGEKDNGEVTINQDESPILISARLNLESGTFNNKNIDFYNNLQKSASLSNVNNLINAYEKILKPLGPRNLVIITSPDLNNYLRFSGNNIFLSVN